MQVLVDTQRVAAVEPRAEQDRLPEIAHDRQVRIEVHLRDIEEEGAQRRVGEGAGVEVAHQLLDVGAVGDVRVHASSGARPEWFGARMVSLTR